MAPTDNQVRTHFLNVKDHLDRVVYSLIRTTNHEMADELFVRIKEGEATFAQMARMFSEGPEANTGGIVGPVCLQQAHPDMAERLRSTPVGRILKPFWFKEFSIILRVEDLIQARFEDHKDGIRRFLSAT